jgi:hypothetical protein
MAISTSPREIDRKLHRVVREADSSLYSTAIALGRAIETANLPEFAYQRGRDTVYANADTISTYVLYARDIRLLDGDLNATRGKGDIRSLDNFQQWLSDAVVRYLRDNNASLEQIQAAVASLLSSTPHQLPTLDNLYKILRSPPPRHSLRMSLKVLSLLRPRALKLQSRRLVIIPSIVSS